MPLVRDSIQSTALPDKVFKEETLSESLKNKMHFSEATMVCHASKYGD